MQMLTQLLNFYIQSSLHVGFAVYCLVRITYSTADLPNNSSYANGVFFGTVLGYNFLKYFKLFKCQAISYKKSRAILFVSLIAFVGFLHFFLKLNGFYQTHLFFSGLATLAYLYLRKYGWLKLFLVSFVITYITAFIPNQTGHWYTFALDSNCVQRFLVVISLLIPFEIFDSVTDSKSMNTLPQRLGIQKTKLIGFLLLFPVLILEFFKPNFDYVLIFVLIITAFFIGFSRINRSSYYTSFWGESIPIVWFFLLMLYP